MKKQIKLFRIVLLITIISVGLTSCDFLFGDQGDSFTMKGSESNKTGNEYGYTFFNESKYDVVVTIEDVTEFTINGIGGGWQVHWSKSSTLKTINVTYSPSDKVSYKIDATRSYVVTFRDR